MKDAGTKEETMSLYAGFRTGLEAQRSYSMAMLGNHSLALVWGLVRPRPFFFGLSTEIHWTIIIFWSSAPGGEKNKWNFSLSPWDLVKSRLIMLTRFPFLCPCLAMYPMRVLPGFSPTVLAFKVSQGSIFGFLLKLVFLCDRAPFFYPVLNQSLKLNYLVPRSV